MKAMYPGQDQNQQYQPPTQQPAPAPQGPQYSIDYLNQIAPKPQKQGLNNKLFLALIGGGLLIALIVLVLTLTNSGSGPTQKMETFAARVQSLEKITADAQINIKSNDLRGTNSNLSLFLTNTDQGMTTPLKNNNVDVQNLDPTILASVKSDGDALTAKLEDARLNAVFDRTYAQEMIYQLSTLHTLMSSIYLSSNSKSLKDFLQTTDQTLTPIQKQLEAFNATSS